MSNVRGVGGALPPNDTWTDNQVATVQVGESKLSDVAKRLGMDAQDLQKANPQISGTTSLKTGQDIYLPKNQYSEGPQQLKDHVDDHRPHDLPHAPIGDPMLEGLVRSKLEGTKQKGTEIKDLSEKDLTQLPGGAGAGKVGTQGLESKYTVKFDKIDTAAVKIDYLPHGSEGENKETVGFDAKNLDTSYKPISTSGMPGGLTTRDGSSTQDTNTKEKVSVSTQVKGYDLETLKPW
jgi:hypothetical protein